MSVPMPAPMPPVDHSLVRNPDIATEPPLPAEAPEPVVDSVELEQLSEAIERLAAVEPRLAQVVDLKYFCGFSFGDIAAMWQTSERTVQRDWEKARLFLHRLLQEAAADPAPRYSTPECRDSAPVSDYW